MYVGMPDSKVERPKRVLKDFRRIELKKGERKTVQLSCNLQDMAFYEEETERFIVEHIRYELYIGTSSALSNLKIGECFVLIKCFKIPISSISN